MIHRLAPYLYAAAGGIGGVTLFASDETQFLAGAPKPVHWVVWGCAVLSGVVGVAAAVRHFVRQSIAESDVKTAAAVSGVSADVVDAVRNDLDVFRREQTKRNEEQIERNRAVASTIGPRLVSLDSTIRDVGDVRGELQGMAFQVGELGNRVSRTEKSIDAFHDWKRVHIEEHKKGDVLLKKWAEEYRVREEEREKTPPTGWVVDQKAASK